MWINWVIGNAENPIGVAVDLGWVEALLEHRRNLHGAFIKELDVSGVQAHGNYVHEWIVAQTKVLH